MRYSPFRSAPTLRRSDTQYTGGALGSNVSLLALLRILNQEALYIVDDSEINLHCGDRFPNFVGRFFRRVFE
jgi:hypothetical protein